MLTTDGRLFSWGGFTPCLGRVLYDRANVSQIENELLGSLELGTDGNDFQIGEQVIGEVEFKEKGDDDSNDPKKIQQLNEIL